MFLGHLAAAALLRYYCKTEPLPTLVSSAAPDLVDKALYRGLGVTNSSRTYGHTLLAAALSTAVVHLICGRSAAQSWLLGYLGHLLADANKFVPWFYPLSAHRFRPSRQLEWERPTWQAFRPTLAELCLFVWAAWLYWPRNQS